MVEVIDTEQIEDESNMTKLSDMEDIQNDNDDGELSQTAEGEIDNEEEIDNEKESEREEGEEKIDPTLEKALGMGYNPNYSGPGAKTPEEFVEAAEKRPGIAIERNKKLQEENKELKKVIDYQERTNKLLLSQYEDKIEAQKEKVAAAKEDMDFDAYEREQKKLDRMEGEKTELETPAAEQNGMSQENIDAQILQFVNDSSWFEKEGFEDVTKSATKYMEDNFKGVQVNNQQELDAIFEEANKFARRTYPEKFYRNDTPSPTSQRKSAPPMSSSSAKPAGSSGESAFSANRLNAGDKEVLNYLEKHTWRNDPEDVRKKKRQQFLKSAALTYKN